jgi:hypothetical protein
VTAAVGLVSGAVAAAGLAGAGVIFLMLAARRLARAFRGRGGQAPAAEVPAEGSRLTIADHLLEFYESGQDGPIGQAELQGALVAICDWQAWALEQIPPERLSVPEGAQLGARVAMALAILSVYLRQREASGG